MATRLVLEVTHLTCERDQRLLFDDLAFKGQGGEVIQVEGPNGAGKSTLLKILCGIYDEFSGNVDWQMDEAPLYLGHRPGVTDSLSVAENLAWLAGLHEQTLSRDLLATILTEVGLSGYEVIAAGNLSEGQRKRVSLARYYGFSNKVWVMDEPFSAIDTAGIASLEDLIEAHVASDGLVILTSHQPLDLRVPVTRLAVGMQDAA